MASYADMAARGPKQTPEELDEIVPTESTNSLVDVDSGVSVVSHDFPDQEVKTDTQAQRIELESEAQAAVDEAAVEAEEKAAKAKSKAKKVGRKAEDYAKNPVYAGNAILATILGVTLGVSAYKKYKVGELSWKLVGLYTGAVAAFGAVDFYATRFFNAKYQEKK